jgi:hypothetical protein
MAPLVCSVGSAARITAVCLRATEQRSYLSEHAICLIERSTANTQCVLFTGQIHISRVDQLNSIGSTIICLGRSELPG